MKAKIVIAAAFLSAISISYAAGFYYGGSNMSYYPSFSGYISSYSSAEEVGRYVDEGKKYVENCNNDIQQIVEERDSAIRKVNAAINSYNSGL